MVVRRSASGGRLGVQSNQPIVYIDGVRVRSEAFARNQQASFGAGRGPNVTASPLNDINPADIDRIEVIKGSAASTLYGTEAAAGVIQIFTKRGRLRCRPVDHAGGPGLLEAPPVAPDVDVRPPNDPQRTCQSSDPLCFEGGRELLVRVHEHAALPPERATGRSTPSPWPVVASRSILRVGAVRQQTRVCFPLTWRTKWVCGGTSPSPRSPT